MDHLLLYDMIFAGVMGVSDHFRSACAESVLACHPTQHAARSLPRLALSRRDRCMRACPREPRRAMHRELAGRDDDLRKHESYSHPVLLPEHHQPPHLVSHPFSLPLDPVLAHVSLALLEL
jgi:hypothetical protein